MNLQTKVLICGAGPTGLMMVCQLKRFGVDCIVIDEKPGIVKESRALVVQARTLQIYEQMGIVEKTLELKIKELRNKYLKQLGNRFSLSAFHDEILKDGARPLFVLENKMDAWAAKQK